MTANEVDRLAAAAQDAHIGDFGRTMRALVLFLAYTGIRPGEAFALDHSDIDRVARRVVVKRRLAGGRIDTPKSGRQRTIVLFPQAIQALELLGSSTVGLVFRAKQGGQLSGSLMSGCFWPPVRAAFSRPQLDLYELRHFCAHHMYVTMDLPARVVAAQLGHASPRLVEDLYGHFKVGALEEIDRALGRTTTPLGLVSDASGSQ